jgi:hypothetical protein
VRISKATAVRGGWARISARSTCARGACNRFAVTVFVYTAGAPAAQP